MENIENQETKDFNELINYLCNLKLMLINGKMVKDESPVIKYVPQIKELTKEEIEAEKKSLEEDFNNLCNLKLEISGGKAKKLER